MTKIKPAPKQTQTGLVAPQIPKTVVFLVNDQEVNVALLNAKKQEDAKLKIVDLKDTPGYEAVRLSVATARTTRTTIEKKRKEFSAPHQDYLKMLKTNADELGAICEEIEADGNAKMAVIDTERERIKEEKRKEHEAAIARRKDQLSELGYTYISDVGLFELPDQSHRVNAIQLESFDDAEFADLMDMCLSCAEAYRERKKIADAETAKALALKKRTDARNNQIQALVRGFDLPASFFGDLTDEIELSSDIEWDQSFAFLKIGASADQKRRIDEAKELEELRRFKADQEELKLKAEAKELADALISEEVSKLSDDLPPIDEEAFNRFTDTDGITDVEFENESPDERDEWLNGAGTEAEVQTVPPATREKNIVKLKKAEMAFLEAHFTKVEWIDGKTWYRPNRWFNQTGEMEFDVHEAVEVPFSLRQAK